MLTFALDLMFVQNGILGTQSFSSSRSKFSSLVVLQCQAFLSFFFFPY